LNVTANARDGEAELFIDGVKIGKLPYSGRLSEQTMTIEVRWADPYAKTYSKKDSIRPGATTNVTAVKSVWKVGETGPAGGYIFYDKGSASDGWRFLEAAPTGQSDGIRWFNGKYIEDIKTGTAVGTGRANTEAIIKAQGEGSYAAMLCKKLSLNGYSDWFLPSMDELDLMYKNLKKAGLGGFGGSWLWSSSQSDNNNAWIQNFSSGTQLSDYKSFGPAVRAVRAY
jgi:hypothetical protein